jgi:hypothetical protein
LTTKLGDEAKSDENSGSVAMTVERETTKFTINYVGKKMRLEDGFSGRQMRSFYGRPLPLKSVNIRYLWHVGSRLICSAPWPKVSLAKNFTHSENA